MTDQNENVAPDPGVYIRAEAPAVAAAQQRLIDTSALFVDELHALVEMAVTGFGRASNAGMSEKMALEQLDILTGDVDRMRAGFAPLLAMIRGFHSQFGN